MLKKINIICIILSSAFLFTSVVNAESEADRLYREAMAKSIEQQQMVEKGYISTEAVKHYVGEKTATQLKTDRQQNANNTQQQSTPPRTQNATSQPITW
ncbi:MAG: hypothetical protein KAT32_04115 [Candidatus Moranbacteria bacterium]|nr:hypothetical protein [Candidatus Moranbacteria bacterium]